MTLTGTGTMLGLIAGLAHAVYVFRVVGSEGETQLPGQPEMALKLSKHPMTFASSARKRLIERSFHECLGGFAACGLLRGNFAQSATVVKL